MLVQDYRLLYLNLQWWSGGCIPLQNSTVFSDKKLCEVPFDTISKNATFLGFKELVQGWCILAIHINLLYSQKWKKKHYD